MALQEGFSSLHLCSVWAEPVVNNPYSCSYKCCGTTFTSDKGFDSLFWHSKSEKYSKNSFKIQTCWKQWSSFEIGNLLPYHELIRYPTVTRVVKAALALAHGSAYVEREFARSGTFLAKNKAIMSERNLNAKMSIKEGIRYDGISLQLLMTAKLIYLGRRAYASYMRHQEENQRVAGKQKRKRCWQGQ